MKCHDYMLTSTSVDLNDKDYLIFCKVYGSKSGNFSLKIPTENFTDYVSKCQKILSKIVLMKPYQLKIGLTIKNYIIQNIWPNTELHLECKSHIEFVTMHLIHCKLLRDFNWKSRNIKMQQYQN